MKSAFRDADRFQPSLLDRLRDDHPRERTESAGAMSQGWAEYRDSVLRDVEWLLNTTSLGSVSDLSPWAEVERSTLNFGVPECCAATASGLSQRRWEVAMQEALARFEPRLREDSIQVRLRPALSAPTSNLVVVEVSAELAVAPIPVRFRATIDRETSAATLSASVADAAGVGSAKQAG